MNSEENNKNGSSQQAPNGNGAVNVGAGVPAPDAGVTPGLTIDQKLDMMLRDMAKLQEANVEKDAQIKTLMQVADKGRMMNIESRKRNKITPVVYVHLYEGQIVKAWKMLIDEVYRDEKGVWRENQIVEIILENDAKKQISYIDFVRLVMKNREPADVIKREQTNVDADHDFDTGTTIRAEDFTLRLQKDGREIILDGRFIN